MISVHLWRTTHVLIPSRHINDTVQLFPSIDALSFTAVTNNRGWASLSLTKTFISRCLPGTFVSVTNQWQNQFRFCQYVTSRACLSVQNSFREHLLNTDLASNYSPHWLVPNAPSRAQITSAEPNFLLQLLERLRLHLDSDLCKLHAKARRHELITSGWTSYTLRVIFFFFLAFHLLEHRRSISLP